MQKNQAMPLFCSRDIFDLKILQFDWPGAFRSIPQEPDFSQIWDLCRNIVNNTNFHYRLIQENLFKNVFNILKKKLFLTHFPYFQGKKNCLHKNLALPSTTSYGFLTLCLNLETTNDITPRKTLNTRRDSRTDRPYFRTLSADHVQK